MSNSHAKIEYRTVMNEYYIEDVGSTNRTWLRLSPEGFKSTNHKLTVQDIIKIGSTVFMV